ncbi:MAG: hypothetical protein ACREBJ_10255, partial [Nitrosotalea sp.]
TMIAQCVLFTKKFSGINDLTNRELEGSVGIDDHVRECAAQAFQNAQDTEFLSKQCVPYFKLELGTLAFKDFEQYLWDSEMECTADRLRSHWIDFYQATYCKKHPEDLRSCRIQKKDLCDLSKITPDTLLPFLRRRICEKLPSAPQVVKDQYSQVDCSKIPKKDEL